MSHRIRERFPSIPRGTEHDRTTAEYKGKFQCTYRRRSPGSVNPPSWDFNAEEFA